MNTDTPRTNDIIDQIKGFRTSSAIYSLEQFSRLLERELTSAQNKIQTLSEIGIDQMDKERSLKSELKTVTEQRDTAIETIQKINYANNAHDEDSVAIYCDEFRKSLNEPWADNADTADTMDAYAMTMNKPHETTQL